MGRIDEISFFNALSVEDNLQSLVDSARKNVARPSEVVLYCEAAISEIERLREFEFMYQGLCE